MVAHLPALVIDWLHIPAWGERIEAQVRWTLQRRGPLMETQSPGVSTRRGTPGLDIFKLAGRSISGFLPSFKTGDSRRIRQPFTSQLEERLATYLEYHPHVRSYQRGD